MALNLNLVSMGVDAMPLHCSPVGNLEAITHRILKQVIALFPQLEQLLDQLAKNQRQNGFDNKFDHA
ncbi:MAG TPA: hypothetical protein VHD90_14445 [Phototrophicaceae bacterium]|nr:hypothetical protein [Phototrophicaceae bacterium]